jgi:hypothetical protein
LLRTGHFHFALTTFSSLVDNPAMLCYKLLFRKRKRNQTGKKGYTLKS